MLLMKEVSFIFDVRIPNIEVICKVFEDKQICIAVAESLKIIEKNTLILSITLSEALYRIKLFIYVTLIQENKQRTFLLNHLTNHYSFVLEESYLDGETFALTLGSLIIHISN